MLYSEKPPRFTSQTKRVIFWAVLAFLVVAALAFQGGNDPDPTPGSYTSVQCDDAEIAFNASVLAIDRMEAEGLSDLSRDRFGSETNFRQFHNDIIIEEGAVLEACGRL